MGCNGQREQVRDRVEEISAAVIWAGEPVAVPGARVEQGRERSQIWESENVRWHTGPVNTALSRKGNTVEWSLVDTTPTRK
jgi:hypothetical protein